MTNDDVDRVVAAIEDAGYWGSVDQDALIRHLGSRDPERFFENLRSHPDVARHRRSDGRYYWARRKYWESWHR